MSGFGGNATWKVRATAVVPALVATLLLVMAAAILGLAPTAACAQDGGTQSLYSEIGVGSRAIGLGSSFMSLADDASSLYWSPAALRNVQDKQFMLMYMPLYQDADATYTYLGAVYPTLSAGAWGPPPCSGQTLEQRRGQIALARIR